MTGEATAVTVGGTLRCTDEAGSSPLSAAEFHGTLDRVASFLDGAANVAEPTVWGQAKTGAIEITFVLHAAPDRAMATIQQIIEAAGIAEVTIRDGSPPATERDAPLAAMDVRVVSELLAV